ncbi:DUF1656 domain-containing protein [Shewanella avicenniae]|uniref:DUF1656 domain-containing protein n=1 Tax=Shewanella avicenniae TaxID=2814294 RepID=A0ABX7QTB5_9GAMM|nr:DUF1656 domain-containing protein [Shewanella avicenniae]QSX34504.1 DUF1656 domain-containing protein [Shewanella avicenniae]
MLEELSFGGLLFSPLLIYIPVAFVMSFVTRQVLYRSGLYQRVWKVAWFETGLYICYLAVVVNILGN